jgi:hypothetical protein
MSKKSWLYQNGRPNIEVSFLTSTGQQTEKRLIADTGNPVAFIISFHDLEEISLGGAPSIGSPWGMLFGAWVEVFIPELQFKKWLVAYANDVIASLTQAEGFDGLAGLKLLDEFIYSGDGTQFCLEIKETNGGNAE